MVGEMPKLGDMVKEATRPGSSLRSLRMSTADHGDSRARRDRAGNGELVRCKWSGPQCELSTPVRIRIALAITTGHCFHPYGPSHLGTAVGTGRTARLARIHSSCSGESRLERHFPPVLDLPLICPLERACHETKPGSEFASRRLLEFAYSSSGSGEGVRPGCGARSSTSTCLGSIPAHPFASSMCSRRSLG